MYDLLIYLGISVITLGIFILSIPGFYSKRKISRLRNRKYQKQISKIINMRLSSKEQIIDLDIILHNILKDVGYKGTLCEMLKQYPEYIYNVEKVCETHKISNELVHNLDNEYSEKFLRLKLAEFTKEIRMLLRNI